MDIKFRLYNKLYSSFFDLVEGSSEVQQTKGLALVLAKANLVEEFLKINHIHSKIRELKFNNAIINSELISKSDEKKRADIVIRLYYDKSPIHCFIIEAKSISKGITSHQVTSQLDEYISKSDLFPELEAFRKSNHITGIILTKYTSVIGSKKFINLTWSDIVEFLRKNVEKSKLINDYYYFVTKIKGSMKYYEQEVYSIPTNEVTNNLANEYPFIYECPNRGRYIVKSKPLYVTFRKSGSGGEMKHLFGLEDIIILNPENDLTDFLNDDSYDKGIRERIKCYCDKVNPSNEEKQFFILSDSNKIELKEPLPKPLKNNTFRAYYSLAKILNGEPL